MARSVTEIKTEIETTIRTFPSLDSFLFPTDPGGSTVSRFNLLIYSVSVAIYTFEVLLDQFKKDAAQLIISVPVHNTGNTRQKILNFQYGDVITLSDDFVPEYDPVTPANRIVTQCAIVDSDTDLMTIKVAKGTSPNFLPLSAPELAALQDYYYGTSTTEGVGVAGVAANWITEYGDRLMVEGNIYYLGQYNSVTVKANVITAMVDYLASFQNDSFNGELFMNKLVDAIQSVEGVSRVMLTNIVGRSYYLAIADGVTVHPQGTYRSYAGFIEEEDTVSYTFDDTLTMALETQGT